jgi:hypothetical protein
VVTYLDARQPDGRDIDRASCVAALMLQHNPPPPTAPAPSAPPPPPQGQGRR